MPHVSFYVLRAQGLKQHKDDVPSKEFFIFQVARARIVARTAPGPVGGTAPPGAAAAVPLLAFCMSCLNRFEQLRVALPANLCLLLPFVGTACIFLVLFGEDTAAWQWCQENLSYAISLGLLRVASGGEAGRRLGGAAPDCSNAVLRFWHASVAKNTAHRFAFHALEAKPQTQVKFINLDCDNVLTDEYLTALVAEFTQPGFERERAVFCKGNINPGVTGRVACSARLWTELGGYDEAAGPVGYQDVDLRERIALKIGPEAKPRWLQGAAACGGCVPNHADWKTDRGPAKIANCDPQILQGMTWGQMNSNNMQLMKARTQGGLLERNRGTQIGAWFVELTMPEAQPRMWEPSPPPADLQGAPVAKPKQPFPWRVEAQPPPAAPASSSGQPPPPKPRPPKEARNKAHPGAQPKGAWLLHARDPTASMQTYEIASRPRGAAAIRSVPFTLRGEPLRGQTCISLISFGLERLIDLANTRATCGPES